jgi:hypothetical protein
MRNKTLVMVFDDFPFEKLKEKKIKNTLYNRDIVFKRLETIPGYSDGIYPSIWTGLIPAQTNFWSPFKFIENQKEVDKNNKMWLNQIKPFLIRIPSKINPYISFIFSIFYKKLMKKNYHYPSFYNFSIDKLFFFDNYQDYIINPEKYNPNQSSIFSLLKENSITYDYIFTSEFGPHYEKVFKNSNSDIIFYLNPILDVFGHKYGPNSILYNLKLYKLLDWINKIITENKFNLIIFSDHGMTDIYYKFKPLHIFNQLNLKLNKDIIVWLDSTLVRIWLWSKKAYQNKKRIVSEFIKNKNGFFYNELKREKYGLNFSNRAYGDLIFQVDPHYEVFPNFYHYLNFLPAKGMHGYIPSHKDSYGIFYSNQLNLKAPKSILDIYKYLKNLIIKD